MKGHARVLGPGGRVSLLETAEPASGALRAGHRLYFRTIVPAVGGLLSDRDAYRYLPRSSAYLPDTETLLAMLGERGFRDVRRRELGLGAAQLISGTRA